MRLVTADLMKNTQEKSKDSQSHWLFLLTVFLLETSFLCYKALLWFSDFLLLYALEFKTNGVNLALPLTLLFSAIVLIWRILYLNRKKRSPRITWICCLFVGLSVKDNLPETTLPTGIFDIFVYVNRWLILWIG